MSHASAPQAIDEHNRLPQVTLTTTAEPGTPLSTIRARITAAAARVPLPSGYSYLLGGVAQQQREAFAPLLFALALSPLLVYMLLAALYESLLLPFAVLLSVPLATAGALAALAAAGTTVNIFSLIGLLMLIGLVSKNAILLVDYIETLRRRGLPREDAILAAARTRLRPIIMTTLTVVGAMLPLAFWPSPGSESRAPMALVLIGGLTRRSPKGA